MASTSDASSNHSCLIDQFCAVTGTDRDKATKMMEICSWNLEMAVNMHVDSECAQNGTSHDSSDLPAPTPDDSDGVRPPIPPTRGVLVEDYSNYMGLRSRQRRTRSVFDGFRDFQAEAKWQEELNSESVDPNVSKKRKTLEDLFRPPLDLIHRGSFESAREAGQNSNKWLMVNIQDSQEFACQVLNRDVWSNSAVKCIISEHFVFWQVYCESSEGQRYMQFYKPVTFPYIAIIDPRTGEKVAMWNNIDSVTFCDVITSFLNGHTIVDGSLPLPQTNHAQSIVDISEDQQIKAAIAASLKDVSVSHPSPEEDDEESELETFDSDSENPPHKPTLEDSVHEKGDISEAWKEYLGTEDDEKTNLVLRLPDGERQSVTWPCSTKLKALLLFSESLGFDCKKYELVTNFPRKNLCELSLDKTLKDLGLYPREMVIIQLRNLMP